MTGSRKRSKKRVTSKDVAAMAGVSQSTVSRVLSNSDTGLISEETARRVREAAAQLGYSPHPIARALRGQPIGLIGLVVREIADPFFAEMIEILSVRVREQGFTMVLGHVRSDPQEGLHMARVLGFSHSDGFIFLGDLKNDEQAIQTLLNEKQPVVGLCRGARTVMVPTVNCNNDLGMRMLITHLRDLGHCRLAFVDGGWIGDIRARRETFLRLGEEVGSKYAWMMAESNNPSGGYQAMKQLLALVPRPTAVLASDDSTAIGVLKAIYDEGLRVPEDISVTGFDDIDIARYTTPALTTIRQPLDEMARQSLQLLIEQISGNKTPEEKLFNEFDPELVVRESTGPVPEDG